MSRELDSRVAVEVMGWTVITPPLEPVEHDDLTRVAVLDPSFLGLRRYIESSPNYWTLREWHPSTDLTAAWSIVEHMRAQGWTYALGDDDLDVRSGQHFAGFWRDGSGLISATSATAPEAICQAALKVAALAAAKGGEGE